MRDIRGRSKDVRVLLDVSSLLLISYSCFISICFWCVGRKGEGGVQLYNRCTFAAL